MADLDPPGHEALTVDVLHENGTAVVRLSGELDLTSCDQARTALDAALSGHPRSVILDIGALDYMDSSGLVLLVQMTSAVQQVQVRNPSPIVRRLIELSGLSEMLHITDDDKS